MSPIAVTFALVNILLLLALPRRWAPLPLLFGACYMTLAQGIEIGPFTFTIIRMLLIAGLIRVAIRGERMTGGLNGLDWLMALWAVTALVGSIFHEDPRAAFVFRLGLAFNACGVYLLFRIFCHSFQSLAMVCGLIAVLLIPVAAEMAWEKASAHNAFSTLGGVPADATVREGRIRAQGPFAHPILAGTVGAVSLPLMMALWRQRRRVIAGLGMVAGLAMIVTCASSGPLMTTAAVFFAVFMWRFREHMRLFRWAGVLLYVALDLVMKAPAYYLIARMDVVGGSTGWHRAALIETAIAHLDEWWLAGTDYTRHWMASGVSWSPDHADITNHYLHLGVVGGLPLMLLFIATLAKAFGYLGTAWRQAAAASPQHQFLIWAIGASLFGHAVTATSISYFDQSFLFVYLVLGAAASARSFAPAAAEVTPRGTREQARPRRVVEFQPGPYPVPAPLAQ